MFLARMRSFFAIVLGIGCFIFAFGFATNTASRWGSIIFGVLFLLVSLGVKKRSKCPACGANWSMETVNEEITQCSGPFRKKDQYGHYQTFERQKIRVTLQCKECGNILYREITRDEQLS